MILLLGRGKETTSRFVVKLGVVERDAMTCDA